MSTRGISQARKELVPGILLDRDGTIIEDYHYVGLIERVQLKPGAAEAIRRFNEAGIPVAIVTNQSGVARGFYPEANVNLVHRYIADELARKGAYVDLFFYSPHHPDGNIPEYTADTQFHKPAPGMAFRAAAALGLDLKQSWVVGDRPEDVELAHSIGAHAIYLGDKQLPQHVGDETISIDFFHSLADAAGFIIERITGMSQSEFPTMHYTGIGGYFNHYTDEIRQVLHQLSLHKWPIADAAEILYKAYSDGSTIWVAGNGGAAAIADHMATDHAKHMAAVDTLFSNVHSLGSNNALTTALANDIGYDSIFSWQLERFGQKDDVLVIFSVSGESSNIIHALQRAKENGISTIAIIGDGAVTINKASLADVIITIPSSNYGIVEDVMSIIQHSLAQYIRQTQMGDEQIKSARF